MANIDIYFGKVVDVKDDKKLHRVRVQIPGFTDKLKPEELPWYYPFFGVKYTPIKGDLVPVLIFEENFCTGFYNYKVDLTDIGLADDDYEDYLEIFNRNDVALTYKLSTGIEFINKVSKIQIEKEKISGFVGDNQIIMDKKRIDLGKDGEATPLGDKTVEALQKQIQHTDDLMKSYNALFMQIASVCTNPFTAPIAAQINKEIPKIIAKYSSVVSSNKQFLKTIQSKKTFIE